MAARFSFLYEKGGSDSPAIRFLEPFEELDYSLLHPVHQTVIRIDWDGRWVPIVRSEFESWLEERQEASFKVWKGNSDLFVRVRRTPSCDILEVGMEGTSESERAELLDSLESYFRRSCRSGRGLAFVFDPVGDTEEFPWDELVAGCHPFSLESIPVAESLIVLVSWWAAQGVGNFGRPDADGILRVGFYT